MDILYMIAAFIAGVFIGSIVTLCSIGGSKLLKEDE